MLAGSRLAPDKGGLMQLVWERTRTGLTASRARGRVGGRPTGVESHPGQDGEGDPCIRHHDRRRGRPAGLVQFLDVIVMCRVDAQLLPLFNSIGPSLVVTRHFYVHSPQ